MCPYYEETRNRTIIVVIIYPKLITFSELNFQVRICGFNKNLAIECVSYF